jgi:hypothetical protein
LIVLSNSLSEQPDDEKAEAIPSASGDGPQASLHSLPNRQGEPPRPALITPSQFMLVETGPR